MNSGESLTVAPMCATRTVWRSGGALAAGATVGALATGALAPRPPLVGAVVAAGGGACGGAAAGALQAAASRSAPKRTAAIARATDPSPRARGEGWREGRP